MHVVIGILKNLKNEILIAQRPPHTSQPGAWEFPGGKVEPEEVPFAALVREFYEEVGAQIISAECWQQVEHFYPDYKVLLDFWIVTQYRGEPYGKEGQSIRWVSPAELNDYTFLTGNQKIIDEIKCLQL